MTGAPDEGDAEAVAGVLFGAMEHYVRGLKGTARELRRNMTPAEKALWQHVRRKQICGMQFYRQKPILAYVVDFYCPAAKLVIEVDGTHHLENQQRERDSFRDRQLEALGLRVLRISNHSALSEMDTVLTTIRTIVQDKKSPFAKGGFRGISGTE